MKLNVGLSKEGMDIGRLLCWESHKGQSYLGVIQAKLVPMENPWPYDCMITVENLSHP